MTRPQDAAVPAFLFVSLLAGGSAQGVWSNAALQLLAMLLIAWAAMRPSAEPPPRAARLLLALVAAGLGLILVQLLPLPPAVWSKLPGREPVAAGYALLGASAPWLPISLDPYESLAASYFVLPPVAAIVAMLVRHAYKESWIAGAVLAATLASVLLGAVQAGSGPARSWAHFYRFTSPGVTGVFANRNHMATLLLAALPFAAAMYVAARVTIKQRRKAFATLALGIGGFVLVVAGLALNSSLAALALSVPVVALSALLLVPAGWRTQKFVVPIAALGLAAAVFAISSSSIRAELSGSQGAVSFQSRAGIWSQTGKAIAETLPAGTGIGTFRQVYATHEAPARIDGTYVNHAHNDYLEWVLETGIPGLLLLAAFLAWWAWQSFRVWRSPVSSAFARAATIASAAILAHSIVDYPLRSAAIAVLFGACLAIIALHERRGRVQDVKHVSIA